MLDGGNAARIVLRVPQLQDADSLVKGEAGEGSCEANGLEFS